jgi:hypothetical protein
MGLWIKFPGLKAGEASFYVIGNTLSAPFRQDSNITEIQSGILDKMEKLPQAT